MFESYLRLGFEILPSTTRYTLCHSTGRTAWTFLAQRIWNMLTILILPTSCVSECQDLPQACFVSQALQRAMCTDKKSHILLIRTMVALPE
jgi:hypothetical protein